MVPCTFYVLQGDARKCVLDTNTFCRFSPGSWCGADRSQIAPGSWALTCAPGELHYEDLTSTLSLSKDVAGLWKQQGYCRTTSRLLEELRVAEAEINEPTETPAQAAQRAANAGCTYAVEELEAKRAELTLLERSCGDATTVDSGLERETSKVRTQLMELQALLRTDIRDVLTLTLYARHHHRPLTPSTSPSRPLAPSPSSPSPRLHRHRHRSNTDVATIYGTTTVPLRELPLLQPVSHRHTSICGAGAGVGDCGAGAGVGDCGAGVGTKPLDCGDADLRV